MGYIAARKDRRSKFDQDTAARDLKAVEYAKEFKSYCGRERVILRRRRTKLKVDQFHIIAQVGQGGYGEVYLARKQETGEVCALKKMKKRTLFKMDEVFIPSASDKSRLITFIDSTRARRTRHPYRHENTLAGSPFVCISGCRACLPRDGIRPRRRLSYSSQQFRRAERGTC